MIIRGIEIELHPEGEAVSDHIRYKEEFFEAEILDYIKEHLPTHETILDIGANIGNHTLYFSNFLEYDAIYAFEPVPANFDILEKNTRNYPRVHISQTAIGDHSGYVNIWPEMSNMGASRVSPEGTILTTLTTIDALWQYGVTLMKIDVEGYEIPVLLGAEKTIKRDKPAILIEAWSGRTGETAELLSSWGYHIEHGWDEPEWTYLWTKN